MVLQSSSTAQPVPDGRSERASSGWPAEWKQKPRKLIGLLLAVAILVTMLLVSPPDGLTVPAFRILMTLAVAMCLWLPEVFHPTISALLLITILPLTGAILFEDSVSGLGDKVIWLLLGVSFLTTALRQTGLDQRFAYILVRRSGGSAAGLLLAVILTGFLSAFVVPNAESRTAMLVTLSVGMLQALGAKPLHSNLGRAMLIATSLTALLSSAAVMTGASATLYAVAYFESVLGYHWTYLGWLGVMLPGVLLTCVALWVILLRMFPPESAPLEDGLRFVTAELERMGKIRPAERKLLALLTVLLVLLLFGQRWGVAREMAFMLVSLSLFMPGLDILDWPTAAKQVQWGTLIFFSASLTLSKAVVNSGAAEWLAARLVALVGGLPALFVTVGVMLLFLLLRFVFTNMTSVLTTLLPVVTSLALSTGRNPVWLGMIAVVASALCLFTPMQSASNFTAYSAGYYDIADLAKVGALVAVAVIVITTAMAMLYWPVLGLHPY